MVQVHPALAEKRLREAMDRYGFTDADRGHAKAGPCWCMPGIANVVKHRGSN